MLYVVAFYPIYVLNLKNRMVITDVFYLILLISTNCSMKIKKSHTLKLYLSFGGGLKY